MREFLCVAEDDPVLAQALKDLDASRKSEQETLEFLKKNAKVVFDRLMESRGEIWTRIGDRLKERKLIPQDYKSWGTEEDRKNSNFTIDVDTAKGKHLMFYSSRDAEREARMEQVKHLLETMGVKL